MGMREKLVEVMEDTRANAAWHHWGYEESADYLISNGVTIPVRCKDCKHNCTFDTLLYCDHVRGLAGSVSPDGYCYLGERKNDGDL